MGFISLSYREMLARHGLDTIGGFWNLQWDWVEEPNNRRNGWSGVVQHAFFDEQVGRFSIFVKREENHNYRSLGHLFHGKPTFFREFRNLWHMKRIGVPTVEPIFYGERRNNGKRQAVLATIALEGYCTLSDAFEKQSFLPAFRLGVLHRLAELVQLMHSHCFQHNSLAGNHVMISMIEDKDPDLRIIDLERMRRNFRPMDRAARDVERFIRHTPTLTTKEHSEFLLHYTRNWSPRQRIRLTDMIKNRLLDKDPEKDLVVL